MYLIEIDVVEVEALQAGGDLIHDMASRKADRVRSGPHPRAHLGRDDDILAPDAEVAQSLSEQDLGLAFGIDIRRIDEIDACLDRPADQRRGRRLIERADRAPEAGAAAEGHGAEADF